MLLKTAQNLALFGLPYFCFLFCTVQCVFALVTKRKKPSVVQWIALVVVFLVAAFTFYDLELKLVHAPFWIHIRSHVTAFLSGPLVWFPAIMIGLNILPGEEPYTRNEQIVLCVWLVFGVLFFLGLVAA